MFAGLRTRARGPADDTGSMPLALLVTLVGVTLSAMLSGAVVTQLKDTRRAEDRVRAVAAAQAGLDAVLAGIRATDGALGTLPCESMPGPTTGRFSGSGSRADGPAYATTLGYFMTDPSDMVGLLEPVGSLANLTPLKAAAQTGGASGVANTLRTLGPVATTAVTTTGTALYDRVLGSVVTCTQFRASGVPPKYALVRAVGTAGGTRRTLYATYTFHTDEETIPGGRLTVAGSGGALCVGTADAPSAGDPVRAVPCTGAAERVLFSYLGNHNLALSKTRYSMAVPTGLCLTADSQTNGAFTTFQPCVTPTDPDQQWRYEVNEQTYYGAKRSGSTVVDSGFCLNAQAVVAQSRIVLAKGGGSCGQAGRAGKAFVVDQTAGAGAAGAQTGQLVNNGEKGRCLDLTNEYPEATAIGSHAPALISYPCKQSFVAGDVFWNHRWFGPVAAPTTPDVLFNQTLEPGRYSSTGQVYARDPKTGNTPWCMRSPGAAGGFVWVVKCSTGGTALRWTVYDAAPVAADSYRVKDVYGNCLEASGWRGSNHVYSNSGWGGISYVITAPCSNDDQIAPKQKWNAPADESPSPLTGIRER